MGGIFDLARQPPQAANTKDNRGSACLIGTVENYEISLKTKTYIIELTLHPVALDLQNQ
jgi:hypothetical protein